jgi:hypothetical protein
MLSRPGAQGIVIQLLDFDEAGVTDLPELPEKAATLNGRGVSVSLNPQDLDQFVTL